MQSMARIPERREGSPEKAERESNDDSSQKRDPGTSSVALYFAFLSASLIDGMVVWRECLSIWCERRPGLYLVCSVAL